MRVLDKNIDDFKIIASSQIVNRTVNQKLKEDINGSIVHVSDISYVFSSFKMTKIEINERKNTGSNFCELLMLLSSEYAKIQELCIDDCEKWKQAFLKCVYGKKTEYVCNYAESIIVFDWMYVLDTCLNLELLKLLIPEILYYASQSSEYIFVLPQIFLRKNIDGDDHYSTLEVRRIFQKQKVLISLFESLGFQPLQDTGLYVLDSARFRQTIYKY